LGVARAAAATGDTARAERAYADLLAIWHRAESGFPELAKVTRARATVRPAGQRAP
jgi:hypothetical protein